MSQTEVQLIKAAAVVTADIADQAVSLDKLPHGTSSNNGKFLRANNGADPTFETVNTDLVSDTSPQLGGELQSNGNDIHMADNDKIRVGGTAGASTDGFELYHDGSASYIEENGTGNLRIKASNLRLADSSNNLYAFFTNGSGGEFYHGGSKKFETTSGGATLTGNFLPDANNTRNIGSDTLGWNSIWASTRFRGNDNVKLILGDAQDLQIYHDGSNSIINDNGTGQLQLQVGGSTKFNTQSGGVQFYGSLYGDDNNKIELGNDQDLKIYHDSSANKSKIETTAGGNLDIGSTHNADVQIKTNSVNRFNFGAGGFAPLANNTYELGSTTNRWSNVYTNDLNLSNEGSSNDVDGTWGSFTIQEGAEDLFLINKRNGKRYKFNLTEVS